MIAPPPTREPPAPVARAGGRISERLRELLATRTEDEFQLRALFDALSGRGHAALLVVMALPFCLPVPLPGLSGIFGLVLAFIGLRIAFARRPWLPGWVLDRRLQRRTLEGLAEKAAVLERRTSRVLRPRLARVCQQRGIHILHGLTIAVLGLLLASPIPFTNILAAFPILLLGLALLEDDGVFILLGYLAAILGVGVFVALVWAGRWTLERAVDEWRQRLISGA